MVVDVARLSPLPRIAGEAGAAERIAAGLRDDVERWSAAIALAEAARDGHLHLRRVRHVVEVPGDAANVARRTDVHSIELNETLCVSAAARREEVLDGRRTASEARGLDRRNRRDVIAVTARRGKRAHDVSVGNGLLSRGLNVHDRRFAGHGDRLLKTAQ